MKRVISIMMSIALLLGFVMPNQSIASQDKDLEKLIVKSKQILEIGDQYSKFEYSISKNEGRTTYDLNWRTDEDTDYISVVIDSEGFIISYNKYSNQDNYENKIPKLTELEGKKIAGDFLKKINPDIKDNLKYKGNDGSRDVFINRYYFEFVRTESGIPYSNNSANVNINNMTGKVESYYANWDKDIRFAKNEDVISKEEAEKLYKEKVKFELMYKYNFTGKDSNPQLVYSIQDKNKSIDAKTGEVIDYSNEFFYNGMMKDEGMGGNINKELTEEELNAIKDAKEMIGESQAEAIAREFALLDKSYKLSYLNMFKNQNAHRWHLDFTKQQNNKFEGAQVSIDAKTKEVVYFNKYTDNTAEKEKYSKNQALEIAKVYLSKVQIEKSKQVEYIDINYSLDSIYKEESPTIYSFKFTRKVNGILFDGDGFNIRVDSTNGEIIGYDISWYTGELQAVSDLISKEEAYKTFANQAKLELQYIKKPDNKEDNKDTVLAYVISNKNKLDIDAKTGKPIDLYSYGSNGGQEKPEYTDIDKSMAKNQIITLKEMGIYLPGSEFKPKEEIKQKDFLYLLLKTKDSHINYEDLDELYKMLIGQRIIKKDEKAQEYNVSREEAVKYIIRSLNYDRVADIKNIYVLAFKDKENIDPSLRGYVAIANGLGIVKGTSDGKFGPTDTLTREQAVLIIYNILSLER